MSYVIVTDSASNLTGQTINELKLEILPLVFFVDGEEKTSYLKGQTTNLKEFYTMMREGKVITTSLPNVAKAEDSIRALLDEGNDILYLGFSSALSGTYTAISLMMQGLQEQYPERVIKTVDTRAASGGEGLLVYLAAQKKAAGASLDEVYTWAEEAKMNIAHWFTVDDLMFLFRGGRVTRTSAWAGTLLNIKPILHVNDEGKLIPQEKVRGRKKSIQALFEHISSGLSQAPEDATVFITHGDCEDEAQLLADMIKDKLGVQDIHLNYIDPVIGAHSGPGTIALYYLAQNRN